MKIGIALIGILTVLPFAGIISSQELSLTATPLKEHVIQGEPVFLKVELRNTSAKPLVLPCGLYESSLALRIQVLKDGKQVRHYGRAVDLPAVSQSKIELSSKTALHLQIDLPFSWDVSTAGQYEVKISYLGERKYYANNRGKPLADADKIWAGEIKAHDVVFHVMEPKGIDKEAYDFLFLKHKTKWENNVIEQKTRMYSDDEIRAEIGRDFGRYDTLDLLEIFPASLYTAYAIWHRQKPDFRPLRAKIPATPEQIIESLVRNSRHPVGEYSRSVRPGERKEEIKNWNLLLRHHPGFVFSDGVYEALGLLYTEDLKSAEAQAMFEKSAGVTKDPERKERTLSFIEALQNPEKKKAAQ